ncbi:aminopeptidase O-like [Herpailurus yagouaroundi]|uniref:aminopeptidase O-like n=1 Tax=Herpailurus yagouaroundi TaxID=1608482 RepID=UPI001AD7D378|nr:aminopeptidase O-like [Puma yagouaroundi]
MPSRRPDEALGPAQREALQTTEGGRMKSCFGLRLVVNFGLGGGWAGPERNQDTAPSVRAPAARPPPAPSLLPDQLVLLLEHLLEQKTLNPRTLQSLERAYRLTQQDAEVRHRWCELIIKHKYTKAYKDVERFLQEDQAMGIYLYGELMVSEDSRQQQVARRCFELTKEQMDRSSAQVVAEMLF